MFKHGLVTSSSIIHYAHLMSVIDLISFQFSDSLINSFFMSRHSHIHSVLTWFTHSIIQSLNDFLIHSPMHLFQSMSFHPIKSCKLFMSSHLVHSSTPTCRQSSIPRSLPSLPPLLPSSLIHRFTYLWLCGFLPSIHPSQSHRAGRNATSRTGQYTLTHDTRGTTWKNMPKNETLLGEDREGVTNGDVRVANCILKRG